MFGKNGKERKVQRELKRLEQIAEAFLKARGVYPADHDEFLALAGRKEVTVFQQTMCLVEAKAYEIGYFFEWFYNADAEEWQFRFTECIVGEVNK